LLFAGEVMRELKACDVMSGRVAAVSANATALEAAKLLLGSGLSGLPVLDDQGRLVGIVSEADLLRRPSEMTSEVACCNEFFTTLLAEQLLKSFDRPVRELMTTKVASVLCNTPLMAIAELLETMRLKWVPVTEHGKVVGTISRADVLRAFVNEVASPARSHPPEPRRGVHHDVTRLLAARHRMDDQRAGRGA
jgi:CBS-domain-containing membrane protein